MNKYKSRRYTLHKRQGGYCLFCGKQTHIISIGKAKSKGLLMATVEHLKPFRDGGKNRANNRAMSCHKCNGGRAHCDPDYYYKALIKMPLKVLCKLDFAFQRPLLLHMMSNKQLRRRRES